MNFFCISLWIIPNNQFEKAITRGLWSLWQLFDVVVLIFNLSKIHLHAEVLTLLKASAMKIRKTQPPQMQAAYLGFSLYLPCTPSQTPPSLPPGSIQAEGWMGVHWHHAWPKFLTSIQVSAGKLEAGFLEALLCMLHFLYVDMISISKANLSMDYQQYMYMELPST